MPKTLKTPVGTPTEKVKNKKRLSGVVVSNKMKDTIVVIVERFVQHPKYQKFFQTRKRYKVDDKGNTANIGDAVIIEETRPISRDKTFKLIEIKQTVKQVAFEPVMDTPDTV